MTERFDCNPCNPSVLQKTIARMMACSPHQCPHEISCFLVARELNRRLEKELSNDSIIDSAGDSLVDDVCADFQERSRLGQQKYGTKMTRQDLSLINWLHHLKSELMDAVLYSEAAIRQLELIEDDGK